MKVKFLNAENLLKGIGYVADDLGITITDGDADLVVTVNEAEKATVKVKLSGKEATITYGDGKARFFRGLAMLINWVKKGETEKEKEENPIFTSNGAMVDMSRNSVMNVKNIKIYFNKMALMGLNMYMLYTEDTYEIEGRPYFGYMRGPYTKAELKELDAYALELGIELIPCIQMLGHLGTHLRWDATYIYKDTGSELLIGSDETYKLIDDMLKVVTECFTSKRIHIGMDETVTVGTGSYLAKNGYRDAEDLYFEHLARVNEMVHSYGLEPMMWSDMFFRLKGKHLDGYVDYDVRVPMDESITEKLPEGIQQVFWDYYNADEEFYAVNIEKHLKYMDKNMMFAGGVWCWSGYCPHFSRSLRHSIPALDACRKQGVKEVLATVWTNGGEGLVMLSLAGLAWYADYEYTGKHDLDSVRECVEYSCGVSYDDIMKCELIEYPHGEDIGIARMLLYNDPLVTLIDKHLEGYDMVSYYKNVTKELSKVTADLGPMQLAFDTIKVLSSLYENKANFGVRLTKAYKEGDKKTMKKMAKECDVLVKKYRALRDITYKEWMEYNKPFGYEVQDIHLGAQIMRFITTKQRILEYLKGDIASIPELEAPRLRLDGLEDDAKPRCYHKFLGLDFPFVSSANRP